MRWRRTHAVIGLGTGVVAGSGALWLLGPDIARPGLQRVNARGRSVATAGGMAPLASVAAAAAVTGFARRGAWRATALACGGLGLAGLVDDVAGERGGAGGPRGFAGHLGALRHGRVTTGMVKVMAGALSGVAATAALPGSFRPLRMVEGGAVIALAANMGNLLDRAPGRTTKVALVTAAALLATGRLPPGPAFAVGATAATLPDDLAEKVMLGDTGANLVGAALGVALVARLGPTGRHLALATLVGLTLASERRSFSKVIAATPAMAWVDALGRLGQDAPPGPDDKGDRNGPKKIDLLQRGPTPAPTRSRRGRPTVSPPPSSSPSDRAASTRVRRPTTRSKQSEECSAHSARSSLRAHAWFGCALMV